MARMHYELPEDLHREAKAAAAHLGITLKEFVLRSLRLAVEEPERVARVAKDPKLSS